jgi:hypothetical protein
MLESLLELPANSPAVGEQSANPKSGSGWSSKQDFETISLDESDNPWRFIDDRNISEGSRFKYLNLILPHNSGTLMPAKDS